MKKKKKETKGKTRRHGELRPGLQDAVSDGRIGHGEEDHVLFQLAKHVELAVKEMSPGTHDVEFVFCQVRWVLIDKSLEKIGMFEKRIPDLEANFRRHSKELVRA